VSADMNREYFTPCGLKMSKGIVFALQAAMMQEQVERIFCSITCNYLPAWILCGVSQKTLQISPEFQCALYTIIYIGVFLCKNIYNEYLHIKCL